MYPSPFDALTVRVRWPLSTPVISEVAVAVTIPIRETDIGSVVRT